MQLDSIMIETLLANASLYDLCCLRKRIRLVLDDETRIQQIKHSLQIGQSIQYFNSNINNLIGAVVVEKQIKRVLVQHIDDGSSWWTHYYAINLSDTQLVSIVKPKCGILSKGNISIGDIVGFEHKCEKIIGKVTKINPKTVGLITTTNKRWKVYYEHLFEVIDAEQNIIEIPMISKYEN